MNNIYVDELPNRCDSCVCYGGASGRCKLLHKPAFITPPKDCPLKLLSTRLAEERKKVVGELKVDIRSLFNSYASSLIDYCIWNKNADANQKLYNNFKRIINDRLVKVLDLFDKRIDQIERGKL